MRENAVELYGFEGRGEGEKACFFDGDGGMAHNEPVMRNVEARSHISEDLNVDY